MEEAEKREFDEGEAETAEELPADTERTGRFFRSTRSKRPVKEREAGTERTEPSQRSRVHRIFGEL